MTPLESAIEQQKAFVASFGQGGPNQPKEGTVDWFRLRAAAAGLAYLQRVGVLDIHHDARACERMYLTAIKHFDIAEVPPPVVVEKETI